MHPIVSTFLGMLSWLHAQKNGRSVLLSNQCLDSLQDRDSISRQSLGDLLDPASFTDQGLENLIPDRACGSTTGSKQYRSPRENIPTNNLFILLYVIWLCSCFSAVAVPECFFPFDIILFYDVVPKTSISRFNTSLCTLASMRTVNRKVFRTLSRCRGQS